MRNDKRDGEGQEAQKPEQKQAGPACVRGHRYSKSTEHTRLRAVPAQPPDHVTTQEGNLFNPVFKDTASRVSIRLFLVKEKQPLPRATKSEGMGRGLHELCCETWAWLPAKSLAGQRGAGEVWPTGPRIGLEKLLACLPRPVSGHD